MITTWAQLSDGTYLQPKRETFKTILADEKNLLWIDMEDPTGDEISILRDDFKFHALLIDDCVSSHSHPKLDEFANYFFLVIHSCFYYSQKPTEEALNIRELDIFVGKNFVITFHNGHIRAINTNRKRCEHDCQIMSNGADFLLYHLLDALVDNYFPILDTLSEQLAKIEELILTDPRPALQSKIFAARRSIVTLRSVVGPQRELVARFIRPGFPFIRENARLYFKDIYDHIFRVYDISEMSRELIAQDMESYISSINWRLNEVMKTLTVIATFFIPVTTVASFYGMNVAIPEVKWGIWGYLAAWFWIAASVITVFVYFKKKRFL
ncbi:MAG: magnesium/cobalt transporter CorA [Candidatus Aureabacteria bacterium]|nr:magnesium/cobalt transporter CorA [Candidatus Auribacterota bacterium]